MTGEGQGQRQMETKINKNGRVTQPNPKPPVLAEQKHLNELSNKMWGGVGGSILHIVHYDSIETQHKLLALFSCQCTVHFSTSCMLQKMNLHIHAKKKYYNWKNNVHEDLQQSWQDMPHPAILIPDHGLSSKLLRETCRRIPQTFGPILKLIQGHSTNYYRRVGFCILY